MKLVNVAAIILSGNVRARSCCIHRVQRLHIQKGKAAGNDSSLGPYVGCLSKYRWPGCCLSSYFLSFMLKSWQIHNKSGALCFIHNAFKAAVVRTSRITSIPLNFLQTLKCGPCFVLPHEQLLLLPITTSAFFLLTSASRFFVLLQVIGFADVFLSHCLEYCCCRLTIMQYRRGTKHQLVMKHN